MDMESWIKRHALGVLVRQASAAVKELKPDGIEANVFWYHLDGLVKEGMIVKVARGRYTLTPAGEQYVGAYSTSTHTRSEYIKTVIMLYAKAGGSYLMYKWSRQPFLGMVGFVQDHVPLGRSLADGLVEAMDDKLNSSATPMYMTSVLVRVEHEGKLVSHMNVMVYGVNVRDIILPYEGRNGTAFVGKIEEFKTMVGLRELFESIEISDGQQEFILTY